MASPYLERGYASFYHAIPGKLQGLFSRYTPVRAHRPASSELGSTGFSYQPHPLQVNAMKTER